MPSYDKNKDYQRLMEEAERRGDYRAAAEYEALRNAKIQGEGLDYPQTNRYQAYGAAVSRRDALDRQLSDRTEFSYDPRNDPLYQRYRAQYLRQGSQAMEDTMGKAAAQTGGYGSSYAQTAGQQMYEQYLQQLDDRVPELYQAAYQRYQREGDRLEEDYSRAAALEKQEYQRLTEGREWEDAQTQRVYQLALKMLSGGVMPGEELLEAAGLRREDAQRLLQAYRK